MITESIKIETESSARSVKDLRKELKDLKDQLLNTQKGTEEYNQTMQKAANIQHELKDQMAELNASAMDFGQRIGNISKTFAGISGAITAATGALSLFGIENEEAQKKMTATMTSLIGITEGFAKIDDAQKAYKRLTLAIDAGSGALGKFKLALISTGLGALVVLLGSIIAYWDDFTEAIGLSSSQLEHLGDVAHGVFNTFTSSLRGIATALGRMIKGDFEGALQALKDGFNVVDNYNKGVAESSRKREEERTRKEQEEAEKRRKIAEAEAKAKAQAAARAAREAEEAERKRIQAAAKLAKYEKDMEAAKYRGTESDRYTKASFDREMKYFNTLLELYHMDSDEYRNTLLQKEQYLQDWDNHFLKVQEDEEKAAIKAQQEADALEQKKLEQAQAELQRQKEERQKLLESFNESLLTEQERLDARYQLLIDAAIKEGEDTLAIQKWYEEEKTKIVEKENNKQMMLDRIKLQNQIQTVNNIGNLMTNLSGILEEGTKEQKALATAGAVINMIAGISNALSMRYTTHTGLWDWALGISQAATIAASGIAQIKKINEVRTDGKGQTGASASSPRVNLGSVVGASPNFTQTVDGAITQTAIKDQRVYVTEHDITSTQKKVEVAQRSATY